MTIFTQCTYLLGVLSIIRLLNKSKYSSPLQLLTLNKQSLGPKTKV